MSYTSCMLAYLLFFFGLYTGVNWVRRGSLMVALVLATDHTLSAVLYTAFIVFDPFGIFPK